jgi:CHAT domain-containing protein
VFCALDFDADRERFLTTDFSGYGFVHLATHATLNSTHPELSSVIFSLVDDAGNPKDGFLRLHDVYGLRLPAELVVLSACQTAIGKDIRGEGLIGLTRGFMYAGASRVVATLWRVDDEATAAMMLEFYRGLFSAEKLTAPAALRQAQLKIRSMPRWRSPYYWAGFVIQGKWR